MLLGRDHSRVVYDGVQNYTPYSYPACLSAPSSSMDTQDVRDDGMAFGLRRVPEGNGGPGGQAADQLDKLHVQLHRSRALKR
jgi:hypothetical protein